MCYKMATELDFLGGFVQKEPRRVAGKVLTS